MPACPRTTDDDVESLRALLASREDLALVVLFGSVARGDDLVRLDRVDDAILRREVARGHPLPVTRTG